MKATCPTSKDHKRFYTVATVQQEWVVNEYGDFIESTNDCSDVVHRPDRDNEWICRDCGQAADVK